MSLSAVSDNKLLANNGSALPLYKAEVLSYSDYYPFGWEMPNRNASSANYRYGFNGKEKDGDLSGDESLVAYDYGFRIYNPGIWKVFECGSVDQELPNVDALSICK